MFTVTSGVMLLFFVAIVAYFYWLGYRDSRSRNVDSHAFDFWPRLTWLLIGFCLGIALSKAGLGGLGLLGFLLILAISSPFAYAAGYCAYDPPDIA